MGSAILVKAINLVPFLWGVVQGGKKTPVGGGDKSLHGVGVLRLLIILSTKRRENILSIYTNRPTPIEHRRCNGFVSAADNFRRHNALRFASVPFRLEPNSGAKRTVF